jgi:hypothetical protein
MAALEDGRHLFVSIRCDFVGQKVWKTTLTGIVGRGKPENKEAGIKRHPAGAARIHQQG